jgi:hypothetical protein
MILGRPKDGAIVRHTITIIIYVVTQFRFRKGPIAHPLTVYTHVHAGSANTLRVARRGIGAGYSGHVVVHDAIAVIVETIT